MTRGSKFDVIIIGGSYAGLSAAMALGRSLKQTLVIDSGKPCNRQTPHSHNFITQDGETPANIARKAKAQVLKYESVSFYDGLAVKGEKQGNYFSITTERGDTFESKKLIFATGIKDLIPEIPGISACWGISVIHCPYCHGYEFRNQRTAIYANGERAFHITSLVSNLTKDITLLTSGEADFTSEQRAKLEQRGIEIIETEIALLEHDSGYLKHVLFRDGSNLSFDAMYAAIPFRQHTDIPASLGCTINEMGYIQTDQFAKTDVDGVFACGDSANFLRSVAHAVYSGGLAGAMANNFITQEQF